MAGLVPAIHAGNASKTGPTWGGRRQSFVGAKLSPLPRSRTFDAPNHVDSRDKPGHDALKLVRRSPHDLDSDDQQLTRQEPKSDTNSGTSKLAERWSCVVGDHRFCPGRLTPKSSPQKRRTIERAGQEAGSRQPRSRTPLPSLNP